jgi:hypothetical protein
MIGHASAATKRSSPRLADSRLASTAGPTGKKSRATVTTLELHHVILAEIITGLDFDLLDRRFARILGLSTLSE